MAMMNFLFIFLTSICVTAKNASSPSSSSKVVDDPREFIFPMKSLHRWISLMNLDEDFISFLKNIEPSPSDSNYVQFVLTLKRKIISKIRRIRKNNLNKNERIALAMVTIPENFFSKILEINNGLRAGNIKEQDLSNLYKTLILELVDNQLQSIKSGNIVSEIEVIENLKILHREIISMDKSLFTDNFILNLVRIKWKYFGPNKDQENCEYVFYAFKKVVEWGFHIEDNRIKKIVQKALKSLDISIKFIIEILDAIQNPLYDRLMFISKYKGTLIGCIQKQIQIKQYIVEAQGKFF